MFLKHLDYISPSISFYYKGYLSHSSILSGILSIIAFILILTVTIYFSLDIIERENPTIFYFNHFIEDAGIFPLNSSSFFHFIGIKTSTNEDYYVDFKSFRIIGLETYFHIYSDNKNINNFDHWLYGYCNNETDTKGISHLVNYDFFNKSACIRKYFDSKEQKYYDMGDPKFRWPVIAHGTYNSKSNKYYTLILEKCKKETLSIILGENEQCRSDDEIKEIIGFNSLAHFFYIDYYIDALNYETPLTKFFYRIENTFQINSYPINHLNFYPSSIKTHNGLIFDNIVEKFSYSYERNDVFTYNNDNDTYTVYYLWLNNRMNIYERRYKRIQELISNIGGIYQFITFVSIYLNSFYNNYVVLNDTENLLNSSIFYEKNNINKKNINSHHEKKLHDIKKNHEKEKDKKKEKTDVNIERNRNKILKNSTDIDITKSNDFCINDLRERNYKNKNSEKSENNKIEEKVKIPNFNKKTNRFWKYISFKLSINKNNNSFEIYKNFRIKIISEEHLIRNHLNIYNLLRVNERKINSKRRYSYQLKDLLNLI